MRVRRPWGALSEREFRLLFVGQLTSAFGDRLVPIAIAFAVLDLTGSVTDLGYVLAARTVPMLLLVAAISRVSAIDWTGTLVLNPIGMALVGPLAGGIGIRTTLMASALLTVTSTLVVLTVPSVRALRADEPDLHPAAAV
jgi:MFS family permease